MARHAPKVNRKYHKKDTGAGKDQPAAAHSPPPTSAPIKKETPKKANKSAGRKPPGTGQGVRFVPTMEQRMTVRIAVSTGYTQEAIARLINFPFGISESTLKKHFKEELLHGKEFVDLAVISNLFRQATGTGKGAVTAAIYWTKARLNWRTGEGGGLLKGEGKIGEGEGEVPLEFTLKIGDRDGEAES